MMRYLRLEHRFVEHIPQQVEPGVLYVSFAYATAIHSCCCGCGTQVVTPLSPTDWQMVFDGETVSLHPSIGNWNFPCRSHYFIKRDRVIPAGPKRPQTVHLAKGSFDDRGRRSSLGWSDMWKALKRWF